MSIKTINICDGCGKELLSIKEIYYLDLKTNRFWDGVEMDYRVKNLEFCERCADNIKNILIKLSQKSS